MEILSLQACNCDMAKRDRVIRIQRNDRVRARSMHVGLDRSEVRKQVGGRSITSEVVLKLSIVSAPNSKVNMNVSAPCRLTAYRRTRRRVIESQEEER